MILKNGYHLDNGYRNDSVSLQYWIIHAGPRYIKLIERAILPFSTIGALPITFRFEGFMRQEDDMEGECVGAVPDVDLFQLVR